MGVPGDGGEGKLVPSLGLRGSELEAGSGGCTDVGSGGGSTVVGAGLGHWGSFGLTRLAGHICTSQWECLGSQQSPACPQWGVVWRPG